ncbi:unnamed protein product [Adineta ricciae]|uniref:Uncharacterized protein n=1 Tax=Adineta ricciae TaxID=249248 RepID=A0A815MMT6_ADIRI|nr:unnamed protein product [Adineta ricciae]
MAVESSEQKASGIKVYLNHPWNLVKTGFLVLTWITLGFHLEIIGPTMQAVASNINVLYNGMGSILASRSAGYFTANILGIVLQNIVKQHSYALLILAFVIPALVMFITPFVTSWILMCVLFFTQGAAQGFSDLGGTNILLTIWGVHATAPLNTAHLGYGIGAVFVNLLVRPFLSREKPTFVVATNETLDSTVPFDSKSNIVIPYVITGVLCIIIACGHTFFYIWELKNQREKLIVQSMNYDVVSTDPERSSTTVKKQPSSPYSPRTCGRGYFQYGLILSAVFIAYFFFIGGNDQTFSKFFFTYLTSERFHISNSAASWGIIVYWLSYSIGRLLGAIFSVILSVNMCLNIAWFAGLSLAIAWLVFVWTIGLTSTSLFILGAATGLVLAPIFPLSFGTINQQLETTPVLVALLLCGSALGAITFQKLAGLIMDRNSDHFPTLLIICMLVSIILYIASNVIHFVHRRKTSSHARGSVIRGAPFLPERISLEEKEMNEYLRNQNG